MKIKQIKMFWYFQSFFDTSDISGFLLVSTIWVHLQWLFCSDSCFSLCMPVSSLSVFSAYRNQNLVLFLPLFLFSFLFLIFFFFFYACCQFWSQSAICSNKTLSDVGAKCAGAPTRARSLSLLGFPCIKWRQQDGAAPRESHFSAVGFVWCWAFN